MIRQIKKGFRYRWKNNYLGLEWFYSPKDCALVCAIKHTIRHKHPYIEFIEATLDKVLDEIEKVEAPVRDRIEETDKCFKNSKGHHIIHEFCEYCEPDGEAEWADYFKLIKVAKVASEKK